MYTSNSKHQLSLGNYATRGEGGQEVLCVLMTLKILYPQFVTLLRGNHECENMGRIFGHQFAATINGGEQNIWLIVDFIY
jgi:hypothetical protein